jgi:hypothetical protein
MLSFLELIREEVKQRTFRVRQYAILESLYDGITGWRQALMFRLMHRFCDPMYLDAQQAGEEEQQSLRKTGFPCDPPGEQERQELLRLLDEEIASVREEFEYAEKANEEAVAIERDACLAPEGETWSMMLRQEGALDRSIDRKVRILLRLRKDAANLPIASPSQNGGVRMGNMDDVHDSDIMTEHSQVVEAMQDSKMTKQSGNVAENKGPCFQDREQGANVTENKSSYALIAGMLLKRKEASCREQTVGAVS